MPDVVINCPQCQRQLRVPEEMLGRLVRCPSCSMTFTLAAGDRAAPSSPATVQPVIPAESPYETRTPVAPWEEPSRDRAAAAVSWPAICLLVLALGSLLFNGFFFINSAPNREALHDQIMKQKEFPKEIQDPDKFVAATIGGLIINTGACAVLSLIMLIGSIQMLRLRMYGLGIASSICAMLLLPCCCLLGMPLGIWSLAVLVRPEVKSAFR